MKLTEKQKELLKDLEVVRSEMEVLLEDETIISLPRAYRMVKDNFDAVLQKLEDGEYQEEPY